MSTKKSDGVTRALINLYGMSSSTHVFVAVLTALFALYARFIEHSTFLTVLGLLIAFVFVLFAMASLFREQRLQKLLTGITGQPLDDIAYLDAATIEKLVCTAFTLRGFSRVQLPSRSPQAHDIDLLFAARKQRVAVSTRCWLDRRVDGHYVKRLNSAATALKATQSCVLTCGEFTAEAFEFGQRRGMNLVPGRELVTFLTGNDASTERATTDVPPSGESLPDATVSSADAAPEVRTVPLLFIANTVAERSPDAILNIALSTGAGVVVFGSDDPRTSSDKWPMLAGVLVSELKHAIEPYFAIQKYLEGIRQRHPVRWRAIDESPRAWPEGADELEIAEASFVSPSLVERLQRTLATI